LRAAKRFRAGYRYLRKPAFLINIAQSYRKAGDIDKAIEYYEKYLERARARSRLRPQVKRLLKELHAEKAEAEETAGMGPGATGPPATDEPGHQPGYGAGAGLSQPEARPEDFVAPPPRQAPPPVQHTAFYESWWFWTGVAAVVGAGVGVGVYMGTRGPTYVEQGELGKVSW
jgi:tetratricopeptide (TPR) repeat protein